MNYDDYLNDFLKDSKNKELYDKADVQYQIAFNVVSNRKKNNVTQKKLSELTGIDRADISKIENANANITLDTLQRIAEALGKRVVIEFK